MDREARAPAVLVTDQFPVACLMSCILNDLVHKKTTVAVGNRKTAQKAESMGLRCALVQGSHQTDIQGRRVSTGQAE